MPNIEVTDWIYGSHVIDQPVLIDLLQAPSVVRAFRLNQFGIVDEFYHKTNFSRGEHCVGAMLLIRLLGGSVMEQAAGLLHDVSHTFGSHLIDWVRDDYKTPGKRESAQDDGHADFITRSEIPQILLKHGLNPIQITDYHNLTLLERDAPDLCADRVDYSLRELSTDVAKQIYMGLENFESQIVCRDLQIARLLGDGYLELQVNHWGGFEAVARYTYFSVAVRRALELGVITEADFWTDDQSVVTKLKKSPDEFIVKVLQLLRQNPLPVSGEGEYRYKKFRFIDPPVLNGGKLTRLTKLDSDYKQKLERAKEDNKKGILVPDLVF